MNINFAHYVRWVATKHSLTIKIGEMGYVAMIKLFYGLPSLKTKEK